jgi:hypothetical protein
MILKAGSAFILLAILVLLDCGGDRREPSVIAQVYQAEAWRPGRNHWAPTGVYQGSDG